MCCGGEMTIHVEVIEVAPRLYVFGAGYIAKPLAAMAAACGFRVTVIDERADWLTPERFPSAERSLRAPEEGLRDLATSARDFVVVTTHDHALDQRLVDGLLRRPLRFLGMIGSVPKQRKFALRLKARGFGDQEIARLRTPLGVPIGASTPEEIAISVLGELIAVRRGAPPPPGWTPPAREPRAQEAGETSAAGASGAANGSDVSEAFHSSPLDTEEKRS
jgi:xanthine dehydrogenase accessory factor